MLVRSAVPFNCQSTFIWIVTYCMGQSLTAARFNQSFGFCSSGHNSVAFCIVENTETQKVKVIVDYRDNAIKEVAINLNQQLC